MDVSTRVPEYKTNRIQYRLPQHTSDHMTSHHIIKQTEYTFNGISHSCNSFSFSVTNINDAFSFFFFKEISSEKISKLGPSLLLAAGCRLTMAPFTGIVPRGSLSPYISNILYINNILYYYRCKVNALTHICMCVCITTLFLKYSKCSSCNSTHRFCCRVPQRPYMMVLYDGII